MVLNSPYTGNSELDAFLNDVASSMGDGIGGTVTLSGNQDPTNGDSVGYLKRYIHIKYADNNTGSGFSNSPVNKTYYGIYNSDTTTESTNPADYNWYLTTGFSNDKKLWYSIIGGRQIKFVVSILSPGTKWIFDIGTAIDLDNITIDSVNLQPDVLAVGKLLDVLEGSITESQLFTDLGNRINLIDGPSSLTNSVNSRLVQEANNRTTAINAEASTRAQAILDEASARATADSGLQTQINLLSAAGSGDFAELLAAVQEEQTARIEGDAAEATSRETLAAQVRGSYTGTDPSQLTTGLVYNERQTRVTAETAISSAVSSLQSTVNTNLTNTNAAIASEQTTRANADTVLATSITSLTSTVNTNLTNTNAALLTEAQTRASEDTALATSINTLSSTVSNNYNTLNSAIGTEQTTRASEDTALAQSITTLTSTVGDNTTAIQTEASTRATETGNLFSKYTVKIDTNGYVSGFGLASTANNATPFSNFIVRADNFSIASPSGPTITPVVPFIVYTTPTVVNGITVQPGVYMKSANIETVTADKIDSRGLSIKDASGNVIFASGTPLTSNYITPASGWLNSNVTLGTLGAGAFATLNSITSANASTYIANAAIGSAQVGVLTANNISVNNLSAISADMGTITAGTIRLPATGNSYLIIDGASNRIDVYDNGVLRVRLGNLT